MKGNCVKYGLLYNRVKVSPNSNSYTGVVLQIVFRCLREIQGPSMKNIYTVKLLKWSVGWSQHDFNAISGFSLETVHKLYHLGPKGHNRKYDV